jgi:homoserine kinase
VWVSDEGDGNPCSEEHIATIAYRQAGGTGPIWCEFELEPGRGLGFSAAARAAGAYLAARQQGFDHDPAQQAAYEVVRDLEGHGDNAAPAVFGGLWVVAGETVHRVPHDLPGRLLFWVPEATTLTDESRACLDPLISRADAVFNLGRLGLLLAAAYEQRLDLLARATEDRLHQPPRLEQAPASGDAFRRALKAGAAAAWLSGSGPTVAVVVDDAHHGPVWAALGDGESPPAKVLELPIDRDGAVAV